MVKSNYKYYLANGECIEYSLSPDRSLVDVIDRLVSFYYVALHNIPDIVWVKPHIASALNKEVAQKMSLLVGNMVDPGYGVLRLQTVVGPVTIAARFDLEIPIFIGSEQELKDNSFNASMEEILCE